MKKMTFIALAALLALSGAVFAAPARAAGERVIVAYFSYSGNTANIAKEIQKRTGGDLFEITLEDPYPSDYHGCLVRAKDDQERAARPRLGARIADFEKYDTVYLGYPNWWASIPMPVATLLEEYDFSGKKIIPFCSHGGGRLGQSISAIAKLAPDSEIGEPLSVHYSGGGALGRDIDAWLARLMKK